MSGCSNSQANGSALSSNKAKPIFTSPPPGCQVLVNVACQASQAKPSSASTRSEHNANHLHFSSTIKTMARVHERDHELADCKALGSACISYIYHYYTADVIVDLDTDVPVAFSGGLLALSFLSFPFIFFFSFFPFLLTTFPNASRKASRCCATHIPCSLCPGNHDETASWKWKRRAEEYTHVG